jgi:hypothetical protein
MWRKPSRSATHWAVDDLPEAAGPSMAMTALSPGAFTRGVKGGVSLIE